MAHQDDVKNFEALIFLEQENINCDIKAKELIVNNTKSNIPFLFNLYSVYIESIDNSILSTPDNVYLQVSTIMASKHLTKRLQVPTNIID